MPRMAAARSHRLPGSPASGAVIPQLNANGTEETIRALHLQRARARPRKRQQRSLQSGSRSRLCHVAFPAEAARPTVPDRTAPAAPTSTHFAGRRSSWDNCPRRDDGSRLGTGSTWESNTKAHTPWYITKAMAGPANSHTSVAGTALTSQPARLRLVSQHAHGPSRPCTPGCTHAPLNHDRPANSAFAYVASLQGRQPERRLIRAPSSVRHRVTDHGRDPSRSWHVSYRRLSAQL
jgi:hypothetical protein